MRPIGGRQLLFRGAKQTSLDDPMFSFSARSKLCRRLLPAAALVVSVILILALRRQAPPVTFVKVEREELNQTITSNGKVEPISANVARAEFPTFVEKVMATEGQTVLRSTTRRGCFPHSHAALHADSQLRCLCRTIVSPERSRNHSSLRRGGNHRIRCARRRRTDASRPPRLTGSPRRTGPQRGRNGDPRASA